MTKIKDRLSALRTHMKQRGISYYLILTNDFHQSEYVGEYFQTRQYFSGFTGSAGSLLVGMETAGLWTDGRYYIQAERQLQGSGITLFRMGEEGVPTIEQYLKEHLKKGESLGLDARTIEAREGKKYEALLKETGGSLYMDTTIVDNIWTDRPALSDKPAWLLENCYSGETAARKLSRVREYMDSRGATAHLLASLDDIAWLLNIRGNDIMCNPVVLSYVLLTKEKAVLFTNLKKFSKQQKDALEAQGVTLAPYEGIFEAAGQLHAQSVLFDMEKCSYALLLALPEDATIIEAPNPEVLFKAVKNDTEIANLKIAHQKDGLAVTRFMRWIKEEVKKQPLTEWDASNKQDELRAEQEHFLELSFPTICAYKENAAMMHYSATKEQCAALKPEGILLVDSGGQYYEGTTDITRTYALGPVSDEVRLHFTKVLQGMLHLQNARFLHGCTGLNLDILARGPMWEMDIDYRCGTGHGVGYLLNVHESPNGFRWRKVPERNDGCVLECGMVTTDEPGVYIEGSHGIRIENELLCVEGTKNEYGQFLQFEPLTIAPIDLELVDEALLTDKDRQQLNSYHQFVYETLAPYMDAAEQVWLANATRAI